MMIQSFMSPVFSPFGHILESQSEAGTKRTQLELQPDEPVIFYRHSRPVRLDYLSGMSVLLIRTEYEILYFYLDRAVSIRPDVEFGFLALGEPSAVAIDAEPDQISLPETISPLTEPVHPLHLLTFLPQQSDNGFYFRGEQHPPLELIYVEHGTVNHYCNAQEQAIHAGELLLIGGNQWHMQHAEGEVRFLTIGFLWDGLPFSTIANQIMTATTDLRNELSSLQQLFASQNPYRHELLNARLKLLLLELLNPDSGIPRRMPSSDKMKNQLVDQALRYISQHAGDVCSVADLAAAVNVSPAYLSTLFRQNLDISPGKYITRIRLEECKTLLLTGRLSVSEVADRMGYSSVQHFSKQFRQWTGLSPSQYYRKHRK